MQHWFLTPDEWRAIALSLQAAVFAVAITLPLGVVVGRLLARGKFLGKSLIETAINLPLVLPPVVTGYLLLVVLGRQGWLGRPLNDWLGVRFVFDFRGVVLASAVAAFPLMVRAIRLAFAGVDRRLEQAARTLGAGPVDAFFTVSLPLAWRGVLAGCVLAFARSLGEFGATIVIAGNIPNETQTIPLYIYGLLESPGGLQQAWRVATVSILLAAAALTVSEYLERTRGE